MDLDTLIADAGPEKVERHRQPSMGLDTAELTLTELMADEPAPRIEDEGEPTRDEPLSEALKQAIREPAEPRRARVDKLPEIPSPFAILSSGGTSAPPEMAPPIGASTSSGSSEGHAPVRIAPARIASAEAAAAMADEQADPSSFGPEHSGERSSIERMALLRPPSTAPAAVSEPPADKTSTRAAMGALFDADDSGPGLVLFGDAFDDGAGEGFGPQPGTDPDIAPVPDESQHQIESAPEPQLAGAEDPWAGNPGGAPFGFQAGGPTVVDRAILTPEERQRVTFNSDSPPDPAGSLSEKVVISSVRKLFRR